MKKSIKSTNPKDAISNSKLDLSLVPSTAIIELAKAFTEGKKYSPHNWRKTKVRATVYIASALRHLLAYQDGEDLDPDSKEGKSHLAGVLASIAILVDAKAVGTLVDDRPPKGKAGELLRESVKK